MNEKENLSLYEKLQSFNPIVSWLHGLRYKNILTVLHEFIRNCGTAELRILDIGCGTAKLYSVLDPEFNIHYVGYEVFPEFIDAASERYGNKPNFRIVQNSIMDPSLQMEDFEIIVALESLEHIPEHDVVRLIEKIAAARPKLFICSVPVEVGPSIWLKNLGSRTFGYCRHTEYLWSETFWAGLYRLDKFPPHGIAHKGFDWRWLAQTIRHNMQMKETRYFPCRFIPVWFSTSVFMVAQPRI